MNTGAIRGVNLTGWLMLEPWVTPEVFAATGALSDQDLRKVLGREKYDDVLTKHRDTFITKHDFEQIRLRGFNAVRIVVPWYVFGDQGPYPQGHASCISYVDQAFTWADEMGISVVLTLGLLPGSSPSDDGLSLLCDLAPWQRSAALHVIRQLCQRYSSHDSFLGIEPLSEVRVQKRKGWHVTEGIPLRRLRSYYREAYTVIREAAGPDVLVILSDAGSPSSWKWFMAQSTYTNVWLDVHVYHHEDTMDACAPSGVRKLIGLSKKRILTGISSGLGVMVGEWCAALPISDSSLTPEGRIALERLYVAGQLSAFEACESWFFQTWKTAGRISGWDARIALASFERDMLD